MKRLTTLRHLGLSAIWVAALGATSAQTQDAGAWSSVWGITLSASGHSVPASFTFRLQNRSEKTLQGKNPVFTIFIEDWVYCSAVEPGFRSKTFTIPPGRVITETVRLADLTFSDAWGNKLEFASVATRLRAERWKAIFSIIDELTPKSTNDANSAVSSNWVSFNDKS